MRYVLISVSLLLISFLLNNRVYDNIGRNLIVIFSHQKQTGLNTDKLDLSKICRTWKENILNYVIHVPATNTLRGIPLRIHRRAVSEYERSRLAPLRTRCLRIVDILL